MKRQKGPRTIKGLMQELLTKDIDHKEFKDTEIGRIPKEWEVAKLGETANVRYGLGHPPALETNGIPMISDSTIEMLARDTLLDIIRSFLFLRVEFVNATKVITRYMQYRAANRMVERVIENLRGEEDKNKGLMWHWQGSRKTLPMIFSFFRFEQETRF
jgi:type I site-specific restriction-modification system R (restriction) subunit